MSHRLNLLKIPHHRCEEFLGIARDMVQGSDTEEALVEDRGNPWFEQKLCELCCKLCVGTSLYNFFSLSTRFIASGRRSNGVKLWYCLTKQPVCESQGEVLAFTLAPGTQGNPRKSHLSQTKRLLLNFQPRFRKRDECPRVILGSYPDYSSRVAVLTQSCSLLKWSDTADSEQLPWTENQYIELTRADSDPSHIWGILEAAAALLSQPIAEAVLGTSWSHVPIPLAHRVWSGVSQHLHSVHSFVLFPASHAEPDKITVCLFVISWSVPLTSS